MALEQDDAVAAVADLVVDRIPYLDSVYLWTNRSLRRHQIAFIRKGCAGRAWPEFRVMPWNSFWTCKLIMQRPSDIVFEYLDDMPQKILISRVDFALDLITATRSHADMVQEFFARHLVKRWHGKQHLGRVE